ncbi:MAG: rhomboid family intramembrane serine protease [Fulvivirga sp.]|uniref:rhomboid family intramembrane serine protease n=1 Tax=Fulvivirga sp. TaxID=1931237 RepID=UPI0032F3A50C
MFRLTPVVKNLLIINIVFYILQHVLKGIHFTQIVSLWPVGSEYWFPYQFFTYMFAHSTNDFFHILFNMLGLVFIGPLLEQFWGPKRFLMFYLVTGIGAGVLYGGIKYFQSNQIEKEANVFLANPGASELVNFIDNNIDFRESQRGVPYEVAFRVNKYSAESVLNLADELEKHPDNQNLVERAKAFVKDKTWIEQNLGSMAGASGAIYGILMALGLLFPNTEFRLLFPPIPVKAKYIALVLGGYAIYSTFITNPEDSTAHLAHVGGMVFAFIMIQIWKNDRNKFY